VKLILATNIWSHHQAPIARELAGLLGPDRFRMAVFDTVDAERTGLGWRATETAPWLIGPPRSDADMRALVDACVGADMLVFGHCPADVLRARQAAGKVTLVAAERMLKKPHHGLRLLNPRYARGIARFRKLMSDERTCSLAIGSRAAEDLRRIGAFGDRIWRWGYFVDVPTERPLARAHTGGLKLLWVGRMLGLKRVDTLLSAVARLGASSVVAECLIVGAGPEEKKLRGMATRLGLTPGRVRFVPPVPFPEVRRLMREADVYVLPSNRHEGWGAVAGEAMSEGAVLVANEEAGAARELVTDALTGLLFRDGDPDHLADRLELLARNPGQLAELRDRAWERMHTVWSPRAAAERLLALSEALLRGERLSYADGPCSEP
jgi:glycosyltransferase involved in cell wall biosynthesis